MSCIEHFFFFFWLPSGKIKPQKHLKTLHLLCTIDDLISNKLYPKKNSIKYQILVTWCQYFLSSWFVFQAQTPPPPPPKAKKRKIEKKRSENFDPLKCALGALCSPKFSSASSSSSFSSSCPTRTLLGFGV
jgi:hypothetical protein